MSSDIRERACESGRQGHSQLVQRGSREHDVGEHHAPLRLAPTLGSTYVVISAALLRKWPRLCGHPSHRVREQLSQVTRL